MKRVASWLDSDLEDTSTTQRWLSAIGSATTVVVAIASPLRAAFVESGVAGVVLAVVLGVVIAAQNRGRDPRSRSVWWWCALWVVATGSFAFHRSGPFVESALFWAVTAAPIVSVWILVATAGRWRPTWGSSVAKSVGLVSAIVALAVIFFNFVAEQSIEIVDAGRDKASEMFDSGGTTVPDVEVVPVPASPPSSPPPELAMRFPPADAQCTGSFGAPQSTTSAIPDVVWSLIQNVADDVEDICPVGEVRVSASGELFDQRFFSESEGPEGHIIVRRIGSELTSAYLNPVIGQQYYQQPGGIWPSDWGFPLAAIACGDSLLSLFVRNDDSISGYALWVGTEQGDSDGARRSAWFTPVEVAAEVVTRLGPDQPLPSAVGPALGQEPNRHQEFTRLGQVVGSPGRALVRSELAPHCP